MFETRTVRCKPLVFLPIICPFQQRRQELHDAVAAYANAPLDEFVFHVVVYEHIKKPAVIRSTTGGARAITQFSTPPHQE